MNPYLFSAWAEEDADWADDGQGLAQRLERDLGAVLVPVGPDREYGWQYQVPRDGALSTVGALGRRGEVLTIEADETEAARLAVWFRNALRTLPKRGLRLYDQSYMVAVDVDPGSTPEQLLAGLAEPGD